MGVHLITACNCPSGLCDDRTGQCMCPPHVTGDNCDTCLAETFGFDQLIGCEECNCDPDGVRRRNMACDVVSGKLLDQIIHKLHYPKKLRKTKKFGFERN